MPTRVGLENLCAGLAVDGAAVDGVDYDLSGSGAGPMKGDLGGGLAGHVYALVVSFKITWGTGARFQIDGGVSAGEGWDLGAQCATFAGEQRCRGIRSWVGVWDFGRGRGLFFFGKEGVVFTLVNGWSFRFWGLCGRLAYWRAQGLRVAAST